MRIGPGLLVFFFASSIVSLTARGAGAQTATLGTEIPLQRCDRLPVAILQVDKADKRFLIDTAATSLLNEKSFTSGRTKEVHVQSWNQTTALNAREVSIGELALGSHSLQGVRLPAIDLTAIAKACGGPLDGILGVDLLEQLGVSIDLKRSVARLGVAAPSASEASLIADMGQAMHSCSEAFNNADADRLASCFDPRRRLPRRRLPRRRLPGRRHRHRDRRFPRRRFPRRRSTLVRWRRRSPPCLRWALAAVPAVGS